MKIVNIGEIKSRFSFYVNLAEVRENVVVAKRNKPVAILSPYLEEVEGDGLVLGVMKNEFVVPDNFDQSLDDFETAFHG